MADMYLDVIILQYFLKCHAQPLSLERCCLVVGEMIANFIQKMHQNEKESIFQLRLFMQEKRIGEYRVSEEILGKGSFSTVYAATGRKNQNLAVKVIPNHNIRQSELLYFQREINLLKGCKNEWVVNFVDIKKTKSNFYIFLEYCEGGNLAEYIEKNKRLPQMEALRLFSQLVKGMSCLKKMDIIHRDLKPANIMLKNGNVKIVDFGLARKFYSGELLKTFAGSPLNMAPEILKGQAYSDKVDIYSAGTILYEMLYGVCPYSARTREDLIKEIDKGLKSKDDKEIQVSESVLRILKSMLEPSPAHRIEFSELLDFVQSYEREQQMKRIKEFKERAKKSLPYFSIFGSISAPFFSQSSLDNSPTNLDLRMCSRLIQDLSA